MAKKKSPKSTENESASFEEQVAQLQQIVQQLESGDLGLDESLERYQAGIELLKRCHQTLKVSERKIELLSGVDADGHPVTQPLDEEDETLEDKAEKRSRRRGNSPAGKSRTKSPDHDSVDDERKLF